ncbi:dihydrofolate reductase [Leucobacter sp. UCD-THU]|uniref:dihydrofolate reductase n=1 Tax=Leucobacter sp. UCD-THU TaxID=1292023 RepID=UPI000377B68B|nr:dihydrofolate reductase [Leucobacter sp. UCD-THU]EYT51642.1 dihydrofolate reductase [Leucobacter sp. UCD-THU]
MTRADELRPELTAGVGEGIGMIWAEARGGAIGRGGTMPWHLPEDLAHFKTTTWGAPVIMGRRTWESLPERFRPLPGRENVVVTRSAGFEAPGAAAVPSIEEALERTRGSVRDEYETHLRRLAEDPGTSCQDPGAWPPRAAWIMGGGRLYRAAMPFADELVVTRIELDVPDADTFAPQIGPEWRLAEQGGPLVSTTGLGYRFERWLRR